MTLFPWLPTSLSYWEVKPQPPHHRCSIPPKSHLLPCTPSLSFLYTFPGCVDMDQEGTPQDHSWKLSKQALRLLAIMKLVGVQGAGIACETWYTRAVHCPSLCRGGRSEITWQVQWPPLSQTPPFYQKLLHLRAGSALILENERPGFWVPHCQLLQQEWALLILPAQTYSISW